MAVMTFPRLKSWWPFSLFQNPERGTQETEPRNRTSEADINVTDERSLQVPVVFSCIRLISELVGVLPIHVYKRVPDGRKRDDAHPIAGLLQEPNPLMTGQEYVETTAMQIAGWGNSYTRVNRTEDGRPQILWPLIPSRMEPVREGFDRIVYHYKHDEANEKDYSQGQILHFKGFGSDGIVGLSPLGYARQALGVQISAERYAASFYRGGGKASSVFTPDRPFAREQRQNFQEWLNEIGRAEGSGVWALPIPGKWHDVSIPPEDAQMLVTRQFQIGEIARIFRIPLFLLMEMEKSTSWGTGLEQQNLAFLTYTLAPYLKRIETVMNLRLFSKKERETHFLEFNVEGLLRTDSKTRAEFLSKMTESGLMNRNEARSKENLPPYKGGELFTANAALAPVDKLGQMQETPVDAAARRAFDSE